jgi:hypothetical protein
VPLALFASESAITPPPGTDVGGPRWQSLSGVTQALCVLAVVAAACAVFEIVTLVHRLNVLGEIDDRGLSFGRLDRLDAADDLGGVSSLASVLVTIAVLVVVIVWTWRAAKNSEALGRDHPRLGPGWGIAGWLIPLGNLVLPVLVVQDLWRGSDATTPRGDMRWRIGARSALVGWWWGTVVVSFLIAGPVSSGGDRERLVEDLDALRAADAVRIAGRGFAIAAAVLLIVVVRTLASRQTSTLTAQQTAWTARVAA